ncbi:MAG TPA: SMI1/KNR4 family protein [Verrucomicrobiae bacterium]|nr:SMI1/KNR4 family protein [Verrucomicrobiae bacterium]
MPNQSAISALGAFLKALEEEKIPCILIGMMAAIEQGAPLMTVDYDFWVKLPERQYVRLLSIVRQQQGTILARTLYELSDGTQVNVVFQPDGLRKFDVEFRSARISQLERQKIRVLPLERVIASKRAAGREKDLAALPVLKRTLRLRKKLGSAGGTKAGKRDDQDGRQRIRITMTAVEHIKAAQQGSVVDKRGKVVAMEPAGPLSPEQIEALQKEVGLPLPEELRSVLAFCTRIDGCGLEIDFSGATMDFEDKDAFPNGLPIVHDGCGNFWVLDITPDTAAVAPIFFACHDAPVILYQSPDIASFRAEFFRTSSSLVNDVTEDRLFNVWRTNPGVIDQPTASRSSDPSLRSFAAGLPDHFQIVDLRDVKPGMGFSWGRYGPRTEVRRHGYERIFAHAKPPSRGFFKTLFGR